MAVKRYSQFKKFDGGLADSALSGIEGSFYDGVAVDIRSNPGSVSVHQKLKLDSSTPTELCKFAVNSTDGNSYWFSSESGKVWKRTSAGVWSLVFTNANGACRGALEFDDYIYYAAATTLGRYGPVSGSAAKSDSWQTTLTSATYHPMCVALAKLIIGNDTKIATVDDSGVFTASGTADITFIDIPPEHSIRTLCNFNSNVLVGTYTLDTSSKAWLFQWDVTSPSPLTASPPVPHNIIQAVISRGDIAYAVAGSEGLIYAYDGKNITPTKRIPGDFTTGDYLYVYPGSIADLNGYAMIGVSNGSGNPAKQGLYSLGQRDKNYPLSLTYDYPISTDVKSNIDIGVVLTAGKDIFVCWKYGSSVGVDIIDWDNKYQSAYLTTLAVAGDIFKEKVFYNHVLSYKSKPEKTALTASYLKNFSSTETSLGLTERSDNNKYFSTDQVPETAALQYKVGFTVSNNNAPELQAIKSEWSEEAVT
jgi:hypothetical protein